MDPRTEAGAAREFTIDLFTGKEGGAASSALLDRTLPVAAGIRFLDVFSIWDGERSRALIERGGLARLGVWQGDRLVACAGVRLGELKLSSSRLKVALIGAVATLPEHQ